MMGELLQTYGLWAVVGLVLFCKLCLVLSRLKNRARGRGGRASSGDSSPDPEGRRQGANVRGKEG
jgi:hypothetical protein